LTKEEMKNCVWFKPKLVAQTQFTEWTPDGQLRHSRFVGLREDKDPREVVRESESGAVIEKRKQISTRLDIESELIKTL
jgi:ATP-dependent DNA ligase